MDMRKLVVAAALCLLLAWLPAGCSEGESSLCGGIVVTFDVGPERYNVFITNEQAIEDVFAAERGESDATIPDGRLNRGAVCYNLPWEWHVDPEDIRMVEDADARCDGRPSQVDDDLDHWIETVGRFCPGNASIMHIEDYR
jgi:hypothetical protein